MREENLLASCSFFIAAAILNAVPTGLGTSMASAISSEDATSIHLLTTATFQLVTHKCRGLHNHHTTFIRAHKTMIVGNSE